MKPDHLIIRYLSNEATPAEQEQLFDWVSQSPENQKVFNEYVSLWSAQRHVPEQFDLYKGLRNLNARIDAFDVEEKKKTVFWNTWNVAAAVVLFAVAGIALYYNGIFTYQQHRESLLTETSATSAPTTISLADGTVATLNTGATLKYPEAFDGNTREIYLQGEAFFQVAKDARKPFIIHAAGTTTRVLGTSFNVRSTQQQVVVSVVTGKVEVSDGTQSAILRPNEKVSYANKTFIKEPTDLSELRWNVRVLEFNDVTLEQAAGMIARFYDVPVSFQNEKIKHCLITGKFKNQKLETVLQSIEFSTDVQSEVTTDGVRFFGKGCH